MSTRLRPLVWVSVLGIWPVAACGDDEKAKSDTDATTATDTTTTDTTTTETTTTETTTTETTDQETVTPPSSGVVEALDPKVENVFLPFDSALSPDGKDIYYVGMIGSGEGQGHELFHVMDAGTAGEPTALTTKSGFVLPMGVVTDGTNVFVLDAAYLPTDSAADVREGAVLSVAKAGGTPSVVAGTQGYAPVAGHVLDGTIVFTGRDPSDNARGVFSIGTGGGTVTVVKKGSPFRAPAGVAKADDGKVYVADAIADDGKGGIFKVDDANATLLTGGLKLGTPAGIVITPDQKYLLASAVSSADETSVVLRIELATGAIADTYQPDNIKTNRDAGGLHCASDAVTCVWSDLTAGGDGTGIVYRVKLK